jgi:hypothetical protein
MKRVCVYCGSSLGNQAIYREAATAMGGLLAARGIGLVYGGGNVGLMGVIADAVLAGGGEVIGVIPHSLANREIAHAGVTDLRVVDSMHTRKAMMADLSDAFIAMPGGVGTSKNSSRRSRGRSSACIASRAGCSMRAGSIQRWRRSSIKRSPRASSSRCIAPRSSSTTIPNACSMPGLDRTSRRAQMDTPGRNLTRCQPANL